MYKIAIYSRQEERSRKFRIRLMAAFHNVALIVPLKGEESLKEICLNEKKSFPPDIVIVELNKEHPEDVALFSQIKAAYPEIKFIFIEGEGDCTELLFEVEAEGFLKRPVSGERLYKAVQRVMEKIEEEDESFFMILCKNEIFRRRTEEILYIESKRRIAVIHCKKNRMSDPMKDGEDCYTVYGKLDDIEKRLPESFVRCHQSYILNSREVRGVRPFSAELYCGKKIPISRMKYQEVKDCFEALFMK